MTRRRKAVFILVTLGLAVLLSEGLLRLACFVSPVVDRQLHPWRPPPPRMVDDPVLGHRGNPALPDVDADGFRNPAAPARADVVALGDSLTWGINAASGETWPARLSRRLNVSVYNMGVGGYAAPHALLLKDRALAKGPRLVVLALYLGNDLLEATTHTYRLDGLAFLRPSAPEEVAATRARIEEAEAVRYYGRYRERQREATRRLRGVEAPKEEAGTKTKKTASPLWRQALSRHCRLYGLARAVAHAARGRRRPDALVVARDFEEARRVAEGDPETYLLFDRPPIETVFTPRVRYLPQRSEDPLVKEGLRITGEVIRRLARACRERSCGFLLVLLPTKEYVYRDRVEAAGLETNATYRALLEAEGRAIEILRGQAEAAGVPVLEATAALRAGLAEGRPMYKKDWDGHPGAAGYDVIAGAVAEAIREQGLLRPRAAAEK